MKSALVFPCNRRAQLSTVVFMSFEANHHHSAFPKRPSTQCPNHLEEFSVNIDGFYLRQRKGQTDWESSLAEEIYFRFSRHNHR